MAKKHHPKRAHSAAAKHRKAPKPRYANCGASKTYKRLKPGRYTFKARALDIVGADANPAVRHFTVRALKRQVKKHRPQPKHPKH